MRDYPAPAENNLFASSTDLQAGAAAAIRTLAADGNVTATAGMSPDAAWAEADELRAAERSTFESNIYVQPEEAAERGVMRCRDT